MYRLTDEQMVAREAFNAFCARIATAVAEIAARHGMAADDGEDRTESRYLSIWSLEEDGCRGERVASVRISDHSQRYGGPDWSFEATDSEESIARGLVTVEAEVVRWLSL